jgi:hypothetical protein
MDESPKRRQFRLLPEHEFRALTTQQRIDYLKEAMEVRNGINRQIDGEISALLPGSKKDKP